MSCYMHNYTFHFYVYFYFFQKLEAPNFELYSNVYLLGVNTVRDLVLVPVGAMLF